MSSPHEGGAAGTTEVPSGSAPAKKRGRPRSAPVKVRPAAGFKEAAGGTTTEFIVGTLDTCPMQNVTVAGVSFPRFSGVTSFDKNGMPETPVPCGGIVHLTEDQIEAVKVSVSIRVLRAHGKNPKGGNLYLVNSESYRRSPVDVPLAGYLYMHPRTSFPEGGREWTRPDFVWPQNMLEE